MQIDEPDIRGDNSGETDTDTDTDTERKELEPTPVDHRPVSDVIPGPSVAQMSLALIELQRRFKISQAAMDAVAELVQVATGEASRSPSYFSARSLAEKSDLDYRVVDARTIVVFLRTLPKSVILLASDNTEHCKRVLTATNHDTF